ncbi:MAG TPA: Hpt domain-containing protein, partial [Kofleriaceae bacterium]|nr:Hpt domain-containing protein [Kofleriaceae bacterium]
MSETDLDFDPEELAMLRQLFRTEAHDALEAVTSRVLAGGSVKPSSDAFTEMMRVTHTLKGAAGTVGLDVMVDLTHRLESAFAALNRDATQWLPSTADLIVEVTDGLRGYLDELANDPISADKHAMRLREQIERIARAEGSTPGTAISQIRESIAPPLRDSMQDLLAPSPNDSLSMPTMTVLADDVLVESALEAPSTDVVPEPKSYLRVEPERVDALMSSAGELLFDRTRIERRVQLLRTLARDLARTRQDLRDAIARDAPGKTSLGDAEAELASQAALLSQTTAALLDEIEALRRTIGDLQKGLTRIRMDSARNLFLHAARTLRALRR